jgi:biopolymer transport protein ExbD
MKLNSAVPHKKARIEIIPLIDIMFFLLASFMLVSLSMIKLQAIKTNLPKASTGSNVPKPDFVAIGIDKDGLYYFDKDVTPIPADDIPKRLQPFYAAKQDDLKVFVNADSDTSYASVITALDKVREVGVTKVSFPVKEGTKFDPKKPRPDTTSGILTKAGTPVEPAAPAAAPAAPAAPAP